MPTTLLEVSNRTLALDVLIGSELQDHLMEQQEQLQMLQDTV
jgi:hypothetical protein